MYLNFYKLNRASFDDFSNFDLNLKILRNKKVMSHKVKILNNGVFFSRWGSFCLQINKGKEASPIHLDFTKANHIMALES